MQTSSRLSAPCSAARCSRQGLCTEMVVSIPTMNYSQKPGLWICEGRSFRVHVSLGMFRSTSIAAYQASPALPPSFSPSRKAREAAIERVVKRVTTLKAAVTETSTQQIRLSCTDVLRRLPSTPINDGCSLDNAMRWCERGIGSADAVAKHSTLKLSASCAVPDRSQSRSDCLRLRLGSRVCKHDRRTFGTSGAQ